MGTRADFYVGKGKEAEWIGSVAFDGYRDGIDAQILNCTSPEAFRHAVSAFMKDRDDATLPEQGWPWPWDDSSTSDCSYWHFDGQTWDAKTNYNDPRRRDFYAPANAPDFNDEHDDYDALMSGLEQIEYPNMKDKKRVNLGKRSGIIVLGG